jgi:hypothetical protein
MTKLILKTLVGSRAHGLHKEDSDYDWRGVFLEPTSKILSLNYKSSNIQWIEDKEDTTSYELGHFLHLACKSNPSILECLVSPIEESTEEGLTLRALFPYLWNSVDVYKAFCGYSHNQQKKFMDNKDDRPWKYAVAYLRVLMLAEELLTKGTMTVFIESEKTRNMLKEIKAGLYTKGEIINEAERLKDKVKKAYENNKDKKTDFEAVNEFLLRIRQVNW